MRGRLPQGDAGVSGYERVRCSGCSEVIGAYEPLVVRAHGEERSSSLAAEPELPQVGAEHLHLACAQESLLPTADVVSINRQPPSRAPALATGAAARRPSHRRRAD